MSPDTITYTAGVLLALLFAYLPGLKSWYSAKTGEIKALVMLAALAATTAGAFGLSCLGWFSLPVACDQAGAEGLIVLFVKALVANQATFLATVKPFRS